MSPEEFNYLPEREKLSLLTKIGVKVGKRTDDYFRFELYQLYVFYVEVTMHIRYDIRLSYEAVLPESSLIELYINGIQFPD